MIFIIQEFYFGAMVLLTTNQIFFYGLLLVLAPVLASFLQVVVDRQSWQKSIRGRSYCDKCKHVLSWCQLVPLISYLWLKGHCAFCGHRIKTEYFWGELIFALAWAVILLLHWPVLSVSLYIPLVVSVALYFFAYYDWRYQVIPRNEMLVVLLVTLFYSVFTTGYLFLIGAGLIATLLFFSIMITAWFTKKKWQTVFGSGDLLYILWLTMLFDLQSMTYLLLGASLLGLFTYYFVIKKNKFAFIPYLSVMAYLIINLPGYPGK